MRNTPRNNSASSAEHRRLYPDQYSHPLVGKRVSYRLGDHPRQLRGIVERVFGTRFGTLVSLDTLPPTEAVGIWQVTEEE